MVDPLLPDESDRSGGTCDVGIGVGEMRNKKMKDKDLTQMKITLIDISENSEQEE